MLDSRRFHCLPAGIPASGAFEKDQGTPTTHTHTHLPRREYISHYCKDERVSLMALSYFEMENGYTGPFLTLALVRDWIKNSEDTKLRNNFVKW